MTDADFSPALGGEKAQPEPPPPPPPPPAEEPVATASRGAGPATNGGDDELPPEIAALLAPFGRLAEIFTEAAQGRGTAPASRGAAPPAGGEEVAEALAREVENFMGGAIREISQRLPATLAALNGIFDAVEQAISPLVDDLGNAIDAATAQRPAPAPPEIVDAVDAVDATPVAEREIPPVDLPPNA